MRELMEPGSGHALSLPGGPRCSSGGFSLIETLAALLVTSLGVMSLAGLLASASGQAKASEYRALAVLLAADIADRMRANAGAAHLGSYQLKVSSLQRDAPDAPSACQEARACTAAELSAQDLAQWRKALFDALPQGAGAIRVVASGQAAYIWVMWRDPSTLAGAAQRGLALVGQLECPPDLVNAEPQVRCLSFRVAL
ncbi:type IV pilus modification protein PilV [Ideonella margarita]|uniref:Type IV pilus modification protein PilV n=1 Tax=Ideonella margarita TaxID=2984191 RepID=A0ABU9C8C5_9BURK